MVDISKTRVQLIERALRNLAIIEPGESPPVEAYEAIDDLIDPLIAQLAADSIVYVQDDDAIEVEYFLPIARLLANMAGPDFGSPINEEAQRRDERILRRLTAGKPTYETLKVEYY